MRKQNKETAGNEQTQAFKEFLSMGNARRVRAVMLLLALMQALQLLLYVFQKDGYLHDYELMFLKALIILLSISFWGVLILFSNGNKFLNRHSEWVMSVIAFVTLAWSVINTFKAQSITSDISVYLLALFALSAVVHMKPAIAAVIFGANYLFFAAGIPIFQQNRVYSTSHIMNGLILNVVAFLISVMMYRYSREEFADKQSINQKNSILLHMARHDGLTELYNHQTIYELLEAAAAKAREDREPLSVMLIDLDNFKELNDTFGHTTGDAILKKASENILQNIRNGDMAGRCGGDEFLIILPGSGIEEAKDIAWRLLNAFRSIECRNVTLSFSCGIAELKQETAKQLIEKADKNLYKVKNSGKNNISA